MLYHQIPKSIFNVNKHCWNKVSLSVEYFVNPTKRVISNEVSADRGNVLEISKETLHNSRSCVLGVSPAGEN